MLWITSVDLASGKSHDWQLGIAKAYALTLAGHEAVRCGMTDKNYCLSIRSKGNAIRSRDSFGNNSVGIFEINPNISIKTRFLKAAILDITLLESDASARGTEILEYFRHCYNDLSQEDRDKKFKKNREILEDILRLVQCSRAGRKGNLPQYYMQSSTGRWYCHGPFVSLQNMPKQLRPLVFQGHYDYDIESCHYALFAQMVFKHNFKTPIIDRLLADKAAFRLNIAKAADLPVPEVKQALISLIYGSPLNPSVFCSLGNTLGRGPADNFCKLKIIKLLHAEIKIGARLIIEGYKKRSRRKGSIINDIGRSCTISKSSQASQLAHILQGAEAQILSCIGERWGAVMVLLMHDGFITKKQIHTDSLRQHVLKETNWDVEFSEEKITLAKCTKNKLSA